MSHPLEFRVYVVRYWDSLGMEMYIRESLWPFRDEQNAPPSTMMRVFGCSKGKLMAKENHWGFKWKIMLLDASRIGLHCECPFSPSASPDSWDHCTLSNRGSDVRLLVILENRGDPRSKSGCHSHQRQASFL